MKIGDIKPGRYIIAVSGGVDSIVLLDLLSRDPNLDLVITHFNHGIRDDSNEDEKLVVSLAKKYGLPIKVGRATLGSGASEAEARQARYKFFDLVLDKHEAAGIITAHHRDDIIETALINILRGTGPRGLAAPLLNRRVIRPLTDCSKEEIYVYAKKNNLTWREDSTNDDEKYLRNYLRKRVLPKLQESDKKDFLINIDKVANNLKQQDYIIATLSHDTLKDNALIRSRFSLLPTAVGSELLAYWFRRQNFREFDRPLINRVNSFIKTGLPDSRYGLNKRFDLLLTKTEAKLTTRD